MTAWIALAVSLVTLAWNLLQTYLRWPRIGVILRQHIYIDMTADTAYDRFDLVVINNGAEDATIATVGIRSEDRSRTFDVQRVRDNGGRVDGPELPARVEAHGAILWRVGPEELSDFPPNTTVLGYAHRYRTFRKHPKRWRNPIRVHQTVIASVKNN